MSIKKIFKKPIIKSIQYIQSSESKIKKIEYLRGLYRYPNHMVGRNISYSNMNFYTDVLVFAAHPDDDVLGLGTTLYRHSLNNEHIKVIFVTNGSGRDGESWIKPKDVSKEKSKIRYEEAIQALSLINVSKQNVFCLGFPDGGTQRYLKNIYADIYHHIQTFNPGRIYVHCIEGGHLDHDMTSFVVKKVCKKIGYTNVIEWSEYNPMQPLGSHHVNFLQTRSTNFKENKIDISDKERELKRKMLAHHRSQDVEQFFFQGEAIRKADLSQLEVELYEHCRPARSRLRPFIKKFNQSVNNMPNIITK